MVNSNTEDFDAVYVKSLENRQRVLRKLEEKGLPIEGWECIGWKDTGSADSTCGLCGITKVRYLHHMQNFLTDDELYVGCYCAGGMENDLKVAIERERLNINRVKRKERFFKKKWAPEINGSDKKVYRLSYKRKMLKIMRSQSGYFGYAINGSQWHWNYYKSFDAVRTALFDEIDRPKEVKA